jgi:hypothetical protein
VEKLGTAGDNRLQPVGRRWTTSCTPCGSFLRPQSVESLRPRIHRGLTWSDGLSTVAPVDTIGTTSRSPGCGRQKVTESVESGRNPARIRTVDVVPVAVKRGPTASEQAPEALGAPLGPGRSPLAGPLGARSSTFRGPLGASAGGSGTAAGTRRGAHTRTAGRAAWNIAPEQRKAP